MDAEKKKEFDVEAKQLKAELDAVLSKGRALAVKYQLPMATISQMNIGPFLNVAVMGSAIHLKLLMVMLLKKVAELEDKEGDCDEGHQHEDEDCETCSMKDMCGASKDREALKPEPKKRNMN